MCVIAFNVNLTFGDPIIVATGRYSAAGVGSWTEFNINVTDVNAGNPLSTPDVVIFGVYDLEVKLENQFGESGWISSGEFTISGGCGADVTPVLLGAGDSGVEACSATKTNYHILPSGSTTLSNSTMIFTDTIFTEIAAVGTYSDGISYGTWNGSLFNVIGTCASLIPVFTVTNTACCTQVILN